jgi:hypothetical protein
VAVGFLTDEQAAGYGRFEGEPSQAELERFFFLDDADRSSITSTRTVSPLAYARLSWHARLCWHARRS